MSAALAVLVVIIFTATFLFQRELPGDDEHDVATRLTNSAKRISSGPEQQVLFRASRGEVVINAYGFGDAQSQERLLADLRANLRGDRQNIRVRVVFFPPRVFSEKKKMPDGSRYSELEKMPAIREVQLN